MKNLFWSLILITSWSLFSCSSDKKPEPVNVQPVTKDSSPVENLESITNPYTAIDVSPMDMSYFPVDYPKLKMAHAIEAPPLARVVYSRPHLGGRHLFREVLKYGEPWRLGANEATEIQFYQNAQIEGKKVSAGRYVLYCIPQPDKWTIVLNTNLDSWGLTQDTTRDVAKFTVPVKLTSNHVEFFTLEFEKTPTGADLLMAWSNAEARLPIAFN